MSNGGITPGGPSVAARGMGASVRRPSRFVLPLVWGAVAVGTFAAGSSYYLAGPADRAFSALHDLYAPTGTVGHSLGYIGTFMMAFGVASYMLRKRVRTFQGWGRLSTWLRAHIFLCTLGPFLIVLHTAFKVGGLVSIAFWAMVLVVASGVVGRYVYTRLPRRMDGRLQGLESVRARQAELKAEIAATSGLPAEELEALFVESPEAPDRVGAALRVALSHDLSARRRARQAGTVLDAHGVTGEHRSRVLALLREESATELQLRLLLPFQRLFRHWHTFHLPLAIVMLLVVLVHVGVAIAFGYGWPW